MSTSECKGQIRRAPTGIVRCKVLVMDSRAGEESSQPSTSTGISFAFQKKLSQSRVTLKTDSGLEDTPRSEGSGERVKDYVLSLEGKTIHR